MNSAVWPALDAVALKAIHLDVEDRFATPDEFKASLSETKP